MQRLVQCLLCVAVLSIAAAQAGQAPITAYIIPAGTVGNQAHGGPLGMDFVVNRAITVTSLGCFDSGSDGINGTITTQLWLRSGNSGQAVLASDVFSGTNGTLIGGSRFRPLATPVTLAPGQYTIVAYGYNGGELNGNKGISFLASTTNGTDSPTATPEPTTAAEGATYTVDVANLSPFISFVGGSRFENTPGVFPGFLDGGPADRYLAGTFQYTTVPTSWSIDWGDGSSAQNLNPSSNPATANHVFADEGTYNVSATGPSYASVISADNPTAYYRLNDSGPSNLAADQMNNFNAKYRIGNSLTLGVPGALGGDPNTAIDVGGMGSYLMTGNLAPFWANPVTSITVTCWFNARSPGVILSEIGQAQPNVGWHDSQMEIMANGDLYVRVWPFGAVLVGNASFNTWHHAAVRYNFATSILDGMLDGVQSVNTAGGGRQAPWQFGNQQIYTIGAREDTQLGSGGASFEGQFDELAIFATPLTNVQIAAQFNARNTNYATVVASHTPVNYLRLGENSMTQPAADASPSNVAGSYSQLLRAPQFGVPGALGGDPNTAVSMFGTAGNSNSSCYILSGNLTPVVNSTTSVTASLWFNARGQGVILDEIGTQAPNQAWHDSQIEIMSNGDLYVRVWPFGGVFVGNATFNTWHHVALRYNFGSGILDGMLDGVQSVNSAGGGRQAPWQFGFSQYYALSAPDTTQIGSGGGPANVTVDEFAVFTSALSNAQINAQFAARNTNYAATVQGQNPVLYMRLGESSGGQAAADSGPNQIHGAYVTPAKNATGIIAGNGSFQAAAHGFVEFPSALFNFPANNVFTFECWFKTLTGGVILGNNGDGGFVNDAGPGGHVPGLYVGQDGLLRAEMFWHNGVNPATSAGSVMDGQWHHVANVYNNGTETLYLDGNQIASIGGLGQFGYSNGYRYYLGVGFDSGWPAGRGGWDYFEGNIDEVAFYNTALTPAQIRAHASAAANTVQSIIVNVSNVAPSVAVNGPGVAAQHTSVTYNSNVIDPGTLDGITYVWSVTKDSAPFPVINNTNPSFTFDVGDPGAYVVTLTVNDGDGGVDSDSVNVNVTSGLVVSIDGEPATVNEGSSTTLNASTTVPATLTWEVSVGMSIVATGSGATFNFSQPDEGTFTVTLTGDDGIGTIVSDIAVINVLNVAPAPTINAPVSGLEGSPVNLTSTVADPGINDTFTYAWTIVLGATPIASGSNSTISFTPADNGSYDVTLQVTDNDGDSNITSTSVVVNNVAPVVDAGTSMNVSAGATVTVNGTFTDAGTLDTHTFAWTVSASDGSSVTGSATTSLTFTMPLTPVLYTITFAVTDDDGGVGTDVVYIAVPGFMDIVVDTNVGDSFSYTFDILGIPVFELTPINMPDGITTLADIGLGFNGLKTISGVPNRRGALTIQFSSVGMLGNLIINIHGSGGGDHPRVISAATATPNPAFVGKLIEFTVVATDANGDILSYYWDFGDGTNARGLTVTHTYLTDGKFDASVTVSDGERFASSRLNVFILSASENTYTVDKAQIKFDFKNPTKSKMNVAGRLPIGAGVVLVGATVHVEIPGSLYTQDFILNNKFVGGDGKSRFALQVKVVGTASSNAKFALDLVNGSSIVPAETLFGKLAPLGFLNKPIGKPGLPIDIPLLIRVGTDDPQINTMHMIYTTVKNKSGTAKLVK